VNNSQFANLQATLEELSFVQLKRLRQHVEDMISANQVGKAIAVHEEGVVECAHCCSHEFTKYGTTERGQQRYRCKTCSRTFNSLTGTPLSGMKKQDKWHQYSEGMWLTAKLREAASELGINVKTAWRWRHQLLSKPRQNKPSELHGIIEADETFINESFKGKRTMPRPSRKRGNKSNDIVKVPVLLALDRNGAVTHRVLERNTREELEKSLAPFLTPESVLCTDGNVSYQTIVKNLPFELDHKRLIALDNQRVIDGIYHIQTLNNWMMRWKQWLRQFNGVGTAYLENYIAWFRQMEQSKNDDSWIVYAL
jgi:transposase-like protein